MKTADPIVRLVGAPKRRDDEVRFAIEAAGLDVGAVIDRVALRCDCTRCGAPPGTTCASSTKNLPPHHARRQAAVLVLEGDDS